MPFLTNILPASTRRIVYAVYSLTGLGIGATQAAYGALSHAPPDWLKVVLAVYAFVGTAIGATAASNVQSNPDRPARAG